MVWWHTQLGIITKLWAKLRGTNKGWLNTPGICNREVSFPPPPFAPLGWGAGNHSWIPETPIAATQAADMEEGCLPEVGRPWEEDLKQQRKKDNEYTNLSFLLPSSILMLSSLASGQSYVGEIVQKCPLPGHKAGWGRVGRGSGKADGDGQHKGLQWYRGTEVLSLITEQLANYFLL